MKKIVIIGLLITSSIFLHYYNHHIIINTSRSCAKLENSRKVKEQVKNALLTHNSNLSSRSRIKKLATEKLNMLDCTPNEVINIVRNKKDNTFCLVDYFVPSVEAMTTN